MQRVWSRLALLVLALFIQLGAARAARSSTPLLAASWPMAATESRVERWSSARSALSDEAGGEEGAPSDGSMSLEQDNPLDDVCDSECAALSAVLALQQPSQGPQRLGAGAGMGARRAALEAPFKPPRA